jgi:predicted transcriptional regulator of viral defense system
MTQIEALKRLRRLRVAGLTTRDAAALLQVTPTNANTILRRLAREGFLLHLARGRWALADGVNRLALPELLSAPSPACISLQSALYHHGLIEQIPAVIYAVTTARTRRVPTPLGAVSFHRIPAELFIGFDVTDNGVKIATPEKALFDLIYLAPGRSRLFARLPELEIPRDFRWSRLRRYLARVKSPSRRRFIADRIVEMEQRS